MCPDRAFSRKLDAQLNNFHQDVTRGCGAKQQYLTPGTSLQVRRGDFFFLHRLTYSYLIPERAPFHSLPSRSSFTLTPDFFSGLSELPLETRRLLLFETWILRGVNTPIKHLA